MMKLYLYDHCPYCTRTRMITQLKNIPITYEYLLSDDEQTPIQLTGQKMLPILIKKDSTAMGESLDIVRYLDQIDSRPLLNSSVRPEIESWLTSIHPYSAKLIFPRCTQIKLAEFATSSSREYFNKKKSQLIGEFHHHLNDTPALLNHLHKDLQQLSALIHSSEWLSGQASMEDILIFPILRNFSMVKGVNWPISVKKYLDRMSHKTQITLFEGI